MSYSFTFKVGDVVQLSRDRIGEVKYIGSIKNKNGIFYGIDLNTIHIQKSNGTINGKKYFDSNNATFVRLHRILYLVKRGQKNSRNHIKKCRSKLRERKYIQTLKKRQKMKKTCIIKDVCLDIIQYKIRSYFHRFEYFSLSVVCTEFHSIFHPSMSCMKSSDKYWTNHSLNKYYKISSFNSINFLDLRNNRLLYLTKEERLALKYHLLFPTENSEILRISKTKMQLKDEKSFKTSFYKSSFSSEPRNLKFLSNILQYSSSANFNKFLIILDLNYSGMDDECLWMLCQSLLKRNCMLPELKYLLLLNNPRITDKHFQLLLNTMNTVCANVQYLNLRRCNLNDNSCLSLLNMFQMSAGVSVMHIDLEYNQKMTKLGYDRIQKIYWADVNTNELVIHYKYNRNLFCSLCDGLCPHR